MKNCFKSCGILKIVYDCVYKSYGSGTLRKIILILFEVNSRTYCPCYLAMLYVRKRNKKIFTTVLLFEEMERDEKKMENIGKW
jgi:hypothetical protein